MDKLNISIVLYGEAKGEWQEFYEDAKKVFETVGQPYNYVGTTLMDQMRTVKRTEKRVYRELENGQVESITMQSLIDGFCQAFFDYELTITRDKDEIVLIFNASDYDKIDEEEIISTFSRYVTDPKIEIFELNRLEAPALYAWKVNSEESYPELFPSLKIRRPLG